ncbi:Alpha/Beta hydrolase protein [Aspergillus granulosus]|uniref:Alpha/Beta hydrolase protein n=1 Tax=Aspergillus granulosus TaxID=176169 RepID=A0ABR4HNB4_9EURO
MPLFKAQITMDRVIKTADRILELISTAVLTLTGYLTSFALSFTISRILLVSALLPLYLSKHILTIIPSIIRNITNLLSPRGWSQLAESTKAHRMRSDALAYAQLNGSYRFKSDELFHIVENSRGWMESILYANDTHSFTVCGATVRYIHLKPSYSSILQDGRKMHRPIVLLHGSLSWSYMWRNVIPFLLEQGHEIYAIDWLGHGRSDKMLRPETITFDLHVRTLVEFFEVTNLEGASIAAHGWGGCVALCTLPCLPTTACESVFLLNTFFPPRLGDTSLHYRLLHRAWYCTTSLLTGYLPESAVLRFLISHISQKDVDAYASPFRDLPRSTKCSIERFSHMTPSLPRVILHRARNLWTWKVLEGLCGPQHFNTLNTQARLLAQDELVRKFWGSKDQANGFKVAVVFGDNDPLIRDYKNVLVREINPELMVKWAPRGLWIPGTGHMPSEEKAEDVARLIARLAAEKKEGIGEKSDEEAL